MSDGADTAEKSLIVLCADKEAKLVIEALLARHHALKISPVRAEVFTHPLRDAGVYQGAVEFLRNRSRAFHYAMVFLDRDGSGHEADGSEAIATKLERDLAASGWRDRSSVIVLTPELESWLWVRSNHVPKQLGWEGSSYSDLLDELTNAGKVISDQDKPTDPKSAVAWALRRSQTPHSPAIYQAIANTASWRHCRDPWFGKFVRTVQEWFGLGCVATVPPAGPGDGANRRETEGKGASRRARR